MKSLTIIVFLTIVLTIVLGVWDIDQYEKRPLHIGEQILFDVPAGSSFSRIADRLDKLNVFSTPRHFIYFKTLAKIRQQTSRIRAGEYALEPGMTADNVMFLLTAGRSHQYALTILEGWTFKELLAAVRSHPAIQSELADLAPNAIMSAIGGESQHPEGWFFPDTYLFPRGTTDKDFLGRAYRRMQKVLGQEWEGRASDLMIKTPYEALTLASIIEKETPLVQEHAQVSGVFHRRLRIRMRLQTDPTVIYGMGDSYDGDIRRRDLQRDTPYNTYTRYGLPPTPIAMPGRAAIHAALHPADGDSLYFVASGDGGHYFSKTLDEHNKAVRRYLLGQKK